MKVEIQISPEAAPPYAVIYARELSDEVHAAVDALGASSGRLLSGELGGRIYALRPCDVVLVKTKDGKIVACTDDQEYHLSQRLYELEHLFLRISKTTLINLDQLRSVEPGWGGLMLGVMKNGMQEHISRKYLPELKKQLGMGGK